MKKRNIYTLYRTGGSWYPQPNGDKCIHVISYSLKQAIYMANEDMRFDGRIGIYEKEILNNMKSEWLRFNGEVCIDPVFASVNEALSREEEEYLVEMWHKFTKPYEVAPPKRGGARD